MAKFTDKQVLQLVVSHVNDLFDQLPTESTGSSDLDLYDAGRRSVLKSVLFAIAFFSEYDLN